MSKPGDEALSFLDGIINMMRSLFYLRVFVIFFPIFVVITCVGTFFQRVGNENTVDIVELNRSLHGNSHCYITVGSYKEAEGWLLNNGYECRTVWTRQWSESSAVDVPFTDYWDSSFKTFATKGEPGSPNESIIMLVMDYGDDYPHFAPFRYTEDKNPIDFSRFKTKPAQSRVAAFELGYCSTHYDDPGRFFTYSGTGEWPRGIYDVTKYEKDKD